jgi:hypothetical protein
MAKVRRIAAGAGHRVVERGSDRRSDAFVLGRAAIGPHRAAALLKHPDDCVAGASLIVDRFGGHLR